MKTYRYTLFILMLLITVMACRKESSITDVNTTIPEPEVFIESEVFGLVSAPNGDPIENAQVSWGAATVFTDQNGFFKLKSFVTENIAVLNVKKENYFEAHQSLSPFKEKMIRTNIQLIERQLSGSLSTGTGGAVNISGGGKVEFEANSFVDESGNPYDGTVNVYTTYLDPTLPNLRALMPGNLMALNTENEQRLLKSFGMVNVELESNAGEKLQLSQAATLNVPIPSSLMGQSPNTIPLWHFDIESGVWMEEGQASLQGNEYTGKVSHFTWWNCDIPQNFINLQGSIRTEGIEFPILDLHITVISDGTMGTTSSSNTGAFSGFVPKDEVLLLEIINPCDEVVYSEEIGPFNVDTQLPIITIAPIDIEMVSVTGTALNCDMEIVTNGYALIQIPFTNSFGFFPIENGTFEGGLINCGGSMVTAKVFDYSLGTESLATSLNIADNVNFDNLYTCEEITEAKLSITINGVTEDYFPCTATIQNNVTTQYFTILFQMVQPNGTVDYTITIVNWGLDPLYTFAYEIVETGDPDFVYTFEDVSGDNIIKITESENPGDIMRILINDVTIKKTYSNSTEEDFTSCSLDIKALVN